MKIFNISVLFFILSFMAMGCVKDDIAEDEFTEVYNFGKDCELIADLGAVPLIPESKEFLSYPYGMKKIILKDSTDREYVGNVVEYDDEHTQNILLSTEPCPLDSTIEIQYHFQSEYKRLIVNFDELGIWMSVSISTSVSRESYDSLGVADVCNVFLGIMEEGGPTNSLMTIAVDKRTHPMPYESYSDFQETVVINSEVYYDVYINNIEGKEDYEILYNVDFGILRIRSVVNSNLNLVLDRIE